MKNRDLQIGDPAPDFKAPDETGKTHALKDYRGKTIVLYFYPKDNTPGCTKEACDFRDSFPKYRSRGMTILGVSPDSPESHIHFKEKFQIPFPLLSDVGHEICLAYGVWKEKSMYGRKFFGVERSTFLIGPDGKIQSLWRKVSVPGHVEAVLTSA